MEPTNINTTMAPTDPLHQYAVPMQQQPVSYSVQPNSNTSQIVDAGIFGLIVVGTGTMGANLHKVNDGKMTMGEAVGNSLVKGAAGGAALHLAQRHLLLSPMAVLPDWLSRWLQQLE